LRDHAIAAWELEMNILRTALVQQRYESDIRANLEKNIQGIRQAAEQGASLIVLPELHTSPYFCQEENPDHFRFADTIPGKTGNLLADLARELKVVLVASLFEKRASGLYHNTSVVFEKDGTIAGRYRKMHIPDDPGYYEKFYFSPGDLGFTPVATSVGRLGVLICWDQWFPEAARLMALAGADLLIYPTAIGWDDADDLDEKNRQIEAWQICQRAHAVANCLPLLCVNRTGYESSPTGKGGIRFWGSSFAAGPQGEWLAQASCDREEVLVADIDLEAKERLRRAWPFFRDRRIDAYDGLLRRWLDE